MPDTTLRPLANLHCKTDEQGRLYVIASGGSSGGTSAVDESAFTHGSGSGTPAMGINATDAVGAGKVGVVGILSNRQQKVTLYDSSGNELAVGGGTQYDRDTAAGADDKLTMAGVVRRDTASSPVGADADRSVLIHDASGRLWTRLEQQLDLDSGAGSAPASVVALGLPASGGPVAAIGGAGVVSTQVQRVTLGSDDPAVSSLGILDDWDEADRAKVNLIVGQAGIAAGAGASGVTVPRVTLASDDPAVTVLGATTGAAVITDADGTIQRYLRGLVKLAITAGGFLVTASLAAGSNLIGNVGHGKTIKSVSGSLTSDTDVVAAVSTKRIKVIAYAFFTFGTSASVVLLKSNGAGGTEVWRVAMQSVASQVMGANLAIACPGFLFATVAGEKLTVDVANGDTIHYAFSYFDDDAT